MSSTVTKINFEPVTDILPVQRRDFPLATPALADPLNAAALVDGEWMTLNSSYQILRATDLGTDSTSGGAGVASLKSFPLWAERGRYDVRAMSGTKMPVLYMGDYEFDTRIYDSTVTATGGAPITFVLQPLIVATITIGTRAYTGLVGGLLATTTTPIVGYVTKLPASNGGKLRFMSGWRV